MFIPTRDSTLRLTPPYITVGLIIVNCIVFVYQITLPPEVLSEWFHGYGLVPARLFSGGLRSWLTLFTTLFLHGGFLHLAGNMLYLWIFGDNIESTLGHGKFLLFYLACGIIAASTQVLINPNSSIPMIGTSGAISGVLGAYLLRYPHARVKILFWFFLFIRQFWVPAGYLLGIWFLLQLFNGLGSLGFQSQGGVAWFAHIGGFLAGFVLLLVLEPYERKRIWKKLNRNY
ncbi:MAG: rhomboid family intramembrane serine protease [Candidatus Marinimicrobia bacterium]|jgi:membrane associated rhomboid family serine protease|nr:rhomboid family intramembrane serine protease [Candidatus Neomarinimicrobiota bacterium]MCK9483602.1 rhomboid family intramembrane serine protease [Candidatus Neomarinimicrobiota bacterium]MCK9560954.1 rhomboid family intramembrane serine protease [Candidatus Neomarinimicrobiota bacterium]